MVLIEVGRGQDDAVSLFLPVIHDVLRFGSYGPVSGETVEEIPSHASNLNPTVSSWVVHRLSVRG